MDADRPVILIVDDLKANRLALCRLLRHVDAELVEAENGEQALIQAIAIPNLSLILLDVQMPIMDGYEVAELLREEEQTRHIPIIFITAVHRDENHIIKGYTSGAIDYITKPVQPEILSAKISLFLMLWRLKNGLEQEVKARNELEEKNIFLAHHDLLTELPNRRQLLIDIEKATLRADRQGNEFALLFVDLDGFKAINDGLGHQIGDLVLKTIAERLGNLVRKTDTVARYGGDEFIMLYTDIDDIQRLSGRISEILEIVAKPIHIQNEHIQLSASIGVCVYPDQIDNPDKLIDFADIAMYKAKSQGKNQFCFFSDEMDIEAHKRKHVEQKLRLAIQNEELQVYFQPIVKVQSGDIYGAEALIRWNNPELGFVAPDYFIPLAEDNGLIHEIGAWVFDIAIDQLEKLNETFHQIENFKLRVAINASTLQFKKSDFYQQVKSAINSGKVKPEDLEVEITESLLLEDSEIINNQLSILSDLGVSLSVDDFGTGYSALSYLKRCPVNTVKIDRSFIMGVPNDKEDMVLIHAIIAMAHGLGLKVIAEGIETKEQWQFLQQEGCDYAQGYYFCRPLSYEGFVEWLTEKL
jgi:diguanylate cyclase (GGDEF)-like protein